MALMRIRLTLGRTSAFPEGSVGHGYEFIAPLDANGHIDVASWGKLKKACTVTRFWGGYERRGWLRHVGQGWRFDYDTQKSEDDEPFFKLDKHALVPGAYVSVREHDGEDWPFRVVSVTQVAAPVAP